MFQSDFQIKKAKEFLKLGTKELEKELGHKKDANAKVNNDDVPYEARMKYIIQAYKKDSKAERRSLYNTSNSATR